MRAVNLLPKDAGRSTRTAPKPVPLIGVGGGALLLVVLGVAFFMTSGSLSKKEEELVARQAELASIPRPEETPTLAPDPGAEFADERAPRVAAISTALADRVSWDRVLRRFSLVLPDDVWLQSLSMSTGAADAAAPVDPAAAPTGDQGFAITGRTYSHDGVARLLARLSALPDLGNVQLQTSHLAEVANVKLVEFTITAGVRTDGASS